MEFLMYPVVAIFALLGGGSSKKSNNLDTLSTIAGLVGTLLK